MTLLELSNEERHEKWRRREPMSLTSEKTEDIAKLLLSAHSGNRFNVFPSVEQCVEELVKRITDLVV